MKTHTAKIDKESWMDKRHGLMKKKSKGEQNVEIIRKRLSLLLFHTRRRFPADCFLLYKTKEDLVGKYFFLSMKPTSSILNKCLYIKYFTLLFVITSSSAQSLSRVRPFATQFQGHSNTNLCLFSGTFAICIWNHGHIFVLGFDTHHQVSSDVPCLRYSFYPQWTFVLFAFCAF